MTEKLERFISQNRKYCWESEFEQGEYCIGENDVKEFFVAITGQGANSGSRTGSPDGSLSGERDAKNLGVVISKDILNKKYNTYRCPACGATHIDRVSHFCRNCGVSITWVE